MTLVTIATGFGVGQNKAPQQPLGLGITVLKLVPLALQLDRLALASLKCAHDSKKQVIRGWALQGKGRWGFQLTTMCFTRQLSESRVFNRYSDWLARRSWYGSRFVMVHFRVKCLVYPPLKLSSCAQPLVPAGRHLPMGAASNPKSITLTTVIVML